MGSEGVIVRLTATRKVDVAIRAMRALDQDGQCNGADLAERLDTSVGYLVQVLAPLVHRGWVRGVPGPGGGYRLTVPPGLSLREVVEAVDGPLVDGACVFRGDDCRPSQPCVLHDAAERTRETALRELAATALLPA